ncbi:hypothetical protein F6X40_10620 [Paraburkholderia sp. UCT31]|uniref:hypothetical protein n=1 Tax=Paraburkholderia sp. UCT31 TaxID=2615209 RepID=UPI00165652EA|nr:hypothetical protein [Paraburkholderia sp. UCT31]MBC8737261.1 hypothetical protein [Paraburkholderia sp. UCT31]
MFKKLISAALLATQLSGCSTAYLLATLPDQTETRDKPYYSNQLVRIKASTTEYLNRGFDMGSKITWPEYADKYNWGPEAERYRWIEAGGRDIRPRFLLLAQTPDQVPPIHKGDLLEIQVNNIPDTDYQKGNRAVVVRIVCRKGDSACMDAAEQENGGQLQGIVPNRHADISQFTFTPKFTPNGKLLSAQ